MHLRSSGSHRRLLPEYASVAHLDARSHGNTPGSTALLPSRTDALLPLAWRISRIYPYSPNQLSADAILSCNRDRIARLNWYHTRKSPGGGFCDDIQQLPAARTHPTLPNTTCAACSVANEQCTSRNHPAEATHMRSSGRAPTIRKRIENRLLVRMQQAHISARPIPA